MNSCWSLATLGDLFREFVRLVGLGATERAFRLHLLIDVERLLIRILRIAPLLFIAFRAQRGM